jgi:hypothetical protein
LAWAACEPACVRRSYNGVLESIGEFVGYVKQSKSKIERIRKLYAIMSTVTDLDGIGF